MCTLFLLATVLNRDQRNESYLTSTTAYIVLVQPSKSMILSAQVWSHNIGAPRSHELPRTQLTAPKRIAIWIRFAVTRGKCTSTRL
ncbi:hypothetical protein BDZ89DRAFT_1064973 [Hymenopellis radicata]|nr:hypothetical protein BDZ89DRAFT_1064973 [Hymenopellis radicata]